MPRTHLGAVATILFVGVGLLLLALEPTAAVYPACPLFRLTGFYCPLCGSIRGLHALLHGHLLTALRCNALTTVSVLLIAGRHCWQPLTGQPGVPVSTTGRRVALMLAVAFTLVRNLPAEASSWLRP